MSYKGGGRFPGVFLHETVWVDDPVTIGVGTKVWHFSHILGDVQIGEHCRIGQNVCIGPHVNVGANCSIQNNVSIYEGVELEDDVFCGPSCVFTNVTNPRAFVSRKSGFERTRVGRGATIGANATIICGHDIGAYAFIGAGSVVTTDVLAHALMIGVPARQCGWVSKMAQKLGCDLVCPSDGSRYRETCHGLVEIVATTTRAGTP
jgi:UDP-2-acetamido-3-amino-2,3-dideoxy-glucuronate N-acetyltransferase